MRWSSIWPFRGGPRSGANEPEASGSPGVASGPAPAAGPGAPGDAVEHVRPAWADLPPIAPTVAPAPLTAAALEFATDLAGSRTPEPILGPLGHDLTADGPGGLVIGLAAPILDTRPQTRGGADLPRPARGAAREHRRTVGQPAEGVAEATPSAAPLVPGPGAGANAIAPHALAPVRPGAREARRQLTAVRPETLGAALGASRPAAPGPTGGDLVPPVPPMPAAAVGPSVGPASASGPAKTFGPPAELARPEAPGGGRLGPGVAGAGPARSGVVAPTVPTGRVVRRTGLGAPIGALPPLAKRPLGQAPVSSTQSRATVGEPPPAIDRPSAIGGDDLPLPSLRPRSAGAAETSAARPGASREAVLPTGPGPVRPAVAGGPRGGDVGTRGTARVRQGLAAAASPSVRPVLARDALRPTLSPASGPGVPAGHAPAPGSSSRPGLAPSSGDGPSRVSAQDRVEAGPELPGIPVQRRTSVPGEAFGPSSLPAATTGLGRQAWRGSRADRGTAAEGGARGVPSPIRSDRSASRGGTGPIPVQGAAAVPAGAFTGAPLPAASAQTPSGLAVQRAVDVEELSVQGPIGEVPPPAGAAAEAGAAQGATGGGGSGGTVAGATSEADLDLLARRLYGRLRDRLAGELLLDRERAGLLADH